MAEMIRIALALVALTGLAGCGQAGSGGSSTPPPSTPSRPPSTRPPAATLSTAAGTHRLTIGSYCWTARTQTGGTTGCGDAGNPAMFPGLAVAHAAVGETIVVHLRFTPTGMVEASIGRVHYRLAPAADLRLRVHGPGLLTVDPHHGSDDVEYLARVVTAAS
jgi:hypothetical protein